MRIALNVESVDPASGGVERYVHTLATHLLQDGHEVHIVTRSPFPIPGARFHPVGRLGWSKLADMIHFARASQRILEEGSFDIVHGFGRTLCQDIYRSGGGCHHVYYRQSLKAIPPGPPRWIRGVERRLRPRNLLTRHWERTLYRKRRYRRVIAVSRWVQSQLMEHYGVPREDITVIHNGVDVERFHPRHRELEGRRIREELGLTEAKVFLFVSNNFSLKGLSFLIEALGLLRGRSHRIPVALLVIGKDRPGPFLGRIRSLGIGEAVRFCGPVREGIEKWYGASDVLVHPTLFDPFANVCLEALASGLPVITSPFNGASEILAHGVDGYVLSESLSPEELASNMEAFLDPHHLRECALRAREKAEHYAISHHLKAVMEVYLQVIGEKGITPRGPSGKP